MKRIRERFNAERDKVAQLNNSILEKDQEIHELRGFAHNVLHSIGLKTFKYQKETAYNYLVPNILNKR